MRRMIALLAVMVGTTVSNVPAHAAYAYRIDHLFGGEVSFSTTSADPVGTFVQFIGSDPVVGSGEEERSDEVGLCVWVSSHDQHEPGDLDNSDWSESGCLGVEPSPGAPLTASATIPTVIRIYRGILKGVVEERPSSITLDLTWTAATATSSGSNPSAGPTDGSVGGPVRASTIVWMPGASASVTGSISSAVQGDLLGPRPVASFIDAYYAAVMIDP